MEYVGLKQASVTGLVSLQGIKEEDIDDKFMAEHGEKIAGLNIMGFTIRTDGEFSFKGLFLGSARKDINSKNPLRHWILGIDNKGAIVLVPLKNRDREVDEDGA